jgi:2-polyprenyl-3-methyl-5-hydroxy-6-metoxy-1,4-benzoquinol methylase
VTEWWKTFFDKDYLTISGHFFSPEDNQAQAEAIWSMLDLKPGCRLLDAPCGWGRLSRPLAALGARVLGIDQSETLLAEAEARRGGLPSEQLRYLRHDLRTPLGETGFDVACNIFTSFGYGTEEDDLNLFRTLRSAVRPGGRVLLETNHRDLMCAFIVRASKFTQRWLDGTLFLDDAQFDPISGVLKLNWYWSGPAGSGEKHALWRCYSPTEMVALIQRAGLSFDGAYKGLSKTPYAAEGPDAGGRIAIIATRPE